MQALKFLLILPLLLGISGCFTTEKIVNVPVMVERAGVIAPRPAPVSLYPVKFEVVNSSNLNEFLQSMSEKQGYVVFIGMTVKDYENLALSTQDIARYIKDQKELIVFYESQINSNNIVQNDKNKVQ